MKDRLTLRPAKAEERGALEALQWRASLIHEEYREALLTHPDAIALPAEQIGSGRVCVAEEAGTVLGFSVVLRRDDGDAELDGLFVEPSAWRKGIGRSLVDAGVRSAAREGARAMHVIANPRAEEFYRACGFVQVGECQTRFGIAPTMRREIREKCAEIP